MSEDKPVVRQTLCPHPAAYYDRGECCALSPCRYGEPTPAGDRVLGSSTRGKDGLLRYLPEKATDKQKQRARSSALYQRGDMRLVWISEGDLATLVIEGRAICYGRE